MWAGATNANRVQCSNLLGCCSVKSKYIYAVLISNCRLKEIRYFCLKLHLRFEAMPSMNIFLNILACLFDITRVTLPFIPECWFVSSNL